MRPDTKGINLIKQGNENTGIFSRNYVGARRVAFHFEHLPTFNETGYIKREW